jgi:hypothetical protein
MRAQTRVSVGRGRVGGHDGESRWRLVDVEEFKLCEGEKKKKAGEEVRVGV